MKGAYVERRFGWDCHGLPIETIVEKDLELSGRTSILNYGVAKFNEACRTGVMKYVKEWEYVTNRLGRWIDFENDYKTMDASFMDSVWWVFKQLWDNDRVYQGHRIMPYSWRLATPLSNFEASSNYKDVQDAAVTVRFKLKKDPKVSLLAWTTTAWTLPSNLGVCVHPEIKYVQVKLGTEEVILAEARLDAYFKNKKEYEVVKSFTGQELAGLKYEPLFSYFYADRSDTGFKVVLDEFVTTEEGTGLVHMAPHGEDDGRILAVNKIELVDSVDAEGNFVSQVTDFAGQNIKEAEKNIIKYLKDKELLFKQETISHSYPFCERSDTPLMYKALKAWYVKVEDQREAMLKNNDTITWVPEHIKDGRFGKWLEGARDWNISRNRFWGNPLPIWICDKCDHKECLESKAELEKKVGHEVKDLHTHFVDELHWQCEKCSGQMNRTPEVLDCWFESGAMPYAQLHYPFENKEKFEKSFPADFIAEGLDQTRGWFYTLMVLSTTLFKKAPFKNVIVNGIILAEDGKKMSKRLKNYPDPMEVIDKHGADSLRLFMINSSAVKGENLRFTEAGVKEIVRSVMLPLWNVYSFFTTYANVDQFKPDADLTASQNSLDRWIISRFQTLLTKIEKEMALYHLYAVVPALLDFLEELTNWYIRRSRRRFWSDDKADKQSGYNTLYYILIGFTKTLAPFLPFVTEEIYRNLITLMPEAKESVHLNDYPLADVKLTDLKLEHDMNLISNVVGLGRSLRSRADLKVRQPLASITVVTRDQDDAKVLKEYEHHIKEELNVKDVFFSSKEEDLVTVTVKPDFRALGPIFGKEMGQVSKILSSLDLNAIHQLEDGGKITVLGKELDKNLIEVRREAKGGINIETGKGITVYFDTKLTPDLLAEGISREFVNRVQRMRKEANFDVSDRITVEYFTTNDISDCLKQFSDYIQDETLTVNLIHSTSKCQVGDLIQDHDVEGKSVTISVKR